MPGRASRSTRTSTSTATVARKSSATSLRKPRSTRTSANAVEIPDEGAVTSLRTQICHVFGDAQKTTATQRKLVVNLRKIQEACCYEPPDPKKKAKQDEEFDEGEFNEEVGRCVLRVLGVKKSEPVGDRIIRFLGVFLKHATEKDNAIFQTEDEDEEMVAFPETPSSRLTAHILTTTLGFLTAKDKTVRFRATQMVAHIVNSLDQIDDELFNLIRLGLVKRLRDKEPSVRVQAALGLGRLAENDDEENDDEDSNDDVAGGILVKLLDIMQNDPSAEVRRAVLMNLPLRASTLAWLLERARDLDPVTRRALYGKLLPALGDFRHMSISHREKLLRWGLRDRDEHVRKATARLFRERWIEDCAHDPTSTEEKVPGEVAPPKIEAVLELLERIEVIRSGVDQGIAHEAMHEFWDGRPDYREFITFDDDFWNDLTPESAFLARSLNDYYHGAQDNRVQEMLEEKMPEVIKFAYHVRTHLNSLITFIHEDATRDEEDEEAAERGVEQEFVVEQLLHMALTLDYADEMGRRQMYQIMREAITFPALPEECTKLAVDVLRTVCGKRGESEFYGTVLEAIADVRDSIVDEERVPELDENGEESFHSAQSDVAEGEDATPKAKSKKAKEDEDPEAANEKRVAALEVYFKCLHIVQCMLQNLECDFDASEPLKTILYTLIVPAVRDSSTMIRERGLITLGLCMLLSENLATNNIPIFFRCFNKGTELMKVTAIHTFADVAITFPSLLAPPPRDTNIAEDGTIAPPAVNPLVKTVTKVFLRGFSSDNHSVNIAACTAASKLLLHGILPPTSILPILRAFTLAYFNPESSSNPALRQSLSYFLPVFCHSKLKNATLMAQIAVPVIKQLLIMREDTAEGEEEEMVGWPVICNHLAEWTDGRKVVGATEMSLEGKMVEVKGAGEAHLLLASEVLERALASTCSKDEKKPLLSLLGKLHISTSAPVKGMSDEVVLEQSRTLHALITEAVENQLGIDATSRNMLIKLETSLTKRLGKVESVAQVQDDENAVEAGAEDAEAEAEAEATEVEAAPATDIDAASDAGTEVNTEAEVESEPEEASTPRPPPTQVPRQPKPSSSDVEMADDTQEEEEEEEEGEDTMLAHMQAEGTRMPLDYEDSMDIDMEDEESTMTVGRNLNEKTEQDIMDELLSSEV